MLIATQLGLFSSAKWKQKKIPIPVDHQINRFQFFWLSVAITHLCVASTHWQCLPVEIISQPVAYNRSTG